MKVTLVAMAMIGGGFAPNPVAKMDPTHRFRLALAGLGVLFTSSIVSALYAYGFTTFSSTSIKFSHLFLGFFVLILLVDQIIISGDDSSFLKRLRWAWIITLGTICGFFWVCIWFTPTAKSVLNSALSLKQDSINIKYDDLISPYRNDKASIDSLILIEQSAMSEKFQKVFSETEEGLNGRPEGYGPVAQQLDGLFKRDSLQRAERIENFIIQRDAIDSAITDIENRRTTEINKHIQLGNETGLLKTVSAIDSYIFSNSSPLSDKIFYFAIHLMAFLIEMLVFGMKSGFNSAITEYHKIISDETSNSMRVREIRAQHHFQNVISELNLEVIKQEREYQSKVTDIKVEELKSIGPKFRESLTAINNSIKEMKREFSDDSEIIDEYYSNKVKDKLNSIFSEIINNKI